MNRTELLKKLTTVKPALSTQNILPVLSHVCINNNTIMAFNGAQAIVTEYASDLSCVVPGDNFIKLLNSYTAEDVAITQKKDSLDIKVKKSSVSLATLPIEDYIFSLPELTECIEFLVTKEFLDGIKRCLLSVDPTDLQQSGVVLDCQSKALYSTDNARISKYQLDIDFKSTEKVLLPKVFCQLLKNADCIDGVLYICKDFVLLEYKDGTIYSKIPTDVEFFDYDSVIDSFWPNDLKLVNIPEQLLPALKRCEIVAADKGISLSSKGKILNIGTTGKSGLMKEDIELEAELFDFKTLMDNKHLIDALQAVSSINFVKNPADGVIIFVGKDDKFSHVVLGFTE